MRFFFVRETGSNELIQINDEMKIMGKKKEPRRTQSGRIMRSYYSQLHAHAHTYARSHVQLSPPHCQYTHDRTF